MPTAATSSEATTKTAGGTTVSWSTTTIARCALFIVVVALCASQFLNERGRVVFFGTAEYELGNQNEEELDRPRTMNDLPAWSQQAKANLTKQLNLLIRNFTLQQNAISSSTAEIANEQVEMAEPLLLDAPPQQLATTIQKTVTVTNEANSNKEGQQTTTNDKAMNVLLLYPDDWRYDSIGGVAPYVQTPFLNQLAREGIRFTHNCVTTSICWISRATLFTGQYAARHKSFKLREPRFHENAFVNNRTAWPTVLQDHGYYTGHIGKWQFSDEHGWVRNKFFNWTSMHEGRHWYNVKNRTSGKVETVHAADRARDDVFHFLDNRPKDRPFSLSVAFYPPKAVGTSPQPGAQWSPKPQTAFLFENVTIPMPNDTFHLLPPPVQRERVGRGRWVERFNHTEKYQVSIKNYFRLIYEVDQVSKEIIDKLKSEGLYDNTLIIFTTDNGFFLGEHGLTGKWYPYEESIRVPLIIRDPRMPEHKRNTLDDSFTLNIDLASTILGAAGLESPSVMQGRDISDLYLRDAKDWREEFYYEYTLKQGPWFPTATALVRKDYKYMYWPQMKYECLYDMVNDPHEMNDLGHDPDYQDILQKMRERHNELRQSVK